MTDTSQTAVSCAPPARPKNAQLHTILKWLAQIWRNRKHPHIRDISSRQACDIGLSASERARLSHRWPSQTTHHPHG